MGLGADKCQWKEVTCAGLSLSQAYLKAPLSCLCKNMCFLVSRKPLLVRSGVVVWVLLVCSRTTGTQTLKGNEKQFELAGNSSYQGKFQWNFDQGRENWGELELSEFEFSRFYCIFNLLYHVIRWLHPSATPRNHCKGASEESSADVAMDKVIRYEKR